MSLSRARTFEEHVETVKCAVFEVEDLPSMEPAHPHDEDVPFNTEFNQINETRRKGQDVDSDE
jgi:hypothetical protein